jgi:hypothetical protein
MAHRKPLVDQANDIAAMVMEQCRMEHVSARVLRLQGAQLLVSEFAEMNAHIQRSLSEHGEVTPRLWRELMTNLDDLRHNLAAHLAAMDRPTSGAATPLVAD